MLGSFNNWNTIPFTKNTTSSEDFDEVRNVVIYGISYNMDSLAQLVKYGDMNAADSTEMTYYVIKFLSEPYTLQEDQTTYGQVSKSVEPLVKSKYLIIMK